MLLEQNDEWAASRSRYMSLEKLAQFGDDPQAPPKRIAAASAVALANASFRP